MSDYVCNRYRRGRVCLITCVIAIGEAASGLFSNICIRVLLALGEAAFVTISGYGQIRAGSGQSVHAQAWTWLCSLSTHMHDKCCSVVSVWSVSPRTSRGLG